ncbi:MAG: uracil-DNA glycosylase [Candidatus Cloacimonetes bacterium]|nr:uracil-DNA glycosylase [Candidatus Cloacimonadota bacterium]
MVKFNNSWDNYLSVEFTKDYYLRLREYLKYEYAKKTVYPDMYDIYNALKITAFDDVRIVILGQDPYHGAGQASGLSFSVNKGITSPPSLENIFKELQSDLGCFIPNNGFLEKWAKQGVLLLNSVLTVRANMANSHRGKGWEIFTDTVIKHLNDREKPVIFMLWGNNAKNKKSIIVNPQHKILEAAHPSPLSAYSGFFGCKHFSQANTLLKEMGFEVIDWQIENV